MITEIQNDLIGMLKSLGINKESTLAIMSLTKTDEIRLRLLQAMAQLYKEKGEVTEQDILKLILMLTGSRKKSAGTSTTTEATT
ncbi:MAG: hypothetical protein II297_08835 [Clostridia bacterium]|nr:hypothetical protein [Clostridia bacterium]